MRFSMSPRAQSRSSYKARGSSRSADSDVTTNRGLDPFQMLGLAHHASLAAPALAGAMPGVRNQDPTDERLASADERLASADERLASVDGSLN